MFSSSDSWNCVLASVSELHEQSERYSRPRGVNDIPGTGSGMEAVGSTVGSGANTVHKGAEIVTGC